MFKELLINSATVTSRQETTSYEDGISKKDYSETTTPIKCRVSSLNYKDLQLLQWVDDVEIKVQKMYTLPNVDIKPTDLITFEGKDYKVINFYKAHDSKGVQHHKYFIKLVD